MEGEDGPGVLTFLRCGTRRPLHARGARCAAEHAPGRRIRPHQDLAAGLARAGLGDRVVLAGWQEPAVPAHVAAADCSIQPRVSSSLAVERAAGSLHARGARSCRERQSMLLRRIPARIESYWRIVPASIPAVCACYVTAASGTSTAEQVASWQSASLARARRPWPQRRPALKRPSRAGRLAGTGRLARTRRGSGRCAPGIAREAEVTWATQCRWSQTSDGHAAQPRLQKCPAKLVELMAAGRPVDQWPRHKISRAKPIHPVVLHRPPRDGPTRQAR